MNEEMTDVLIQLQLLQHLFNAQIDTLNDQLDRIEKIVFLLKSNIGEDE